MRGSRQKLFVPEALFALRKQEQCVFDVFLVKITDR